MLVVTSKIQIPLREFEFSYCRSSGPGGQNVNKLNTKAVLRWPVAKSPSLPEAVRAAVGGQVRPGESLPRENLLITSQRFRDAGRNTADCLEKLRRMLLDAAEPPRTRKPTRPTRSSVRRRLENKRQRSKKKAQRRGDFRDRM